MHFPYKKDKGYVAVAGAAAIFIISSGYAIPIPLQMYMQHIPKKDVQRSEISDD